MGLNSLNMQMQDLNREKAYSKGIKESLVLVDNLAFIVNTDKKTVITAIDQNSSDDNIYTNIDGAVVM